MRISHPQTQYQGIAPENMFFVFNDQQIQMATGYIIPFYQQEVYPERPGHLFMQIDAQPSAWAMLFGALLARAEQLREGMPNLPTRLYAQVDARDIRKLGYYESFGFRNDDGEDEYTFLLPESIGAAPMGLQFAAVPLGDEASAAAFIQRINAHRLHPINRDYLTYWQQQPHFMAVGFYKNGSPICEAVVTGTGQTATLMMIYTVKEHRRQGMAKQLLYVTSRYLRERGVLSMYTYVLRRNEPQMGLMRMLKATYTRTMANLPGLDL